MFQFPFEETLNQLGTASGPGNSSMNWKLVLQYFSKPLTELWVDAANDQTSIRYHTNVIKIPIITLHATPSEAKRWWRNSEGPPNFKEKEELVTIHGQKPNHTWTDSDIFLEIKGNIEVQLRILKVEWCLVAIKRYPRVAMVLCTLWGSF